MELIKKFQWIDFVSIGIFLRIGYVAVRRGVLNECIKFIGVLLASFTSLHYYSSFLGRTLEETPFASSRGYLDCIFFAILFSVTVAVVSLIRTLIALFVKRQEYPLWEKWSSLMVALVRGLCVVSVIVFGVQLFSPAPGAMTKSFSYRASKNIAPLVYLGSFTLYQRINPDGQINKEVVAYYEAEKNL